MLRRMVAVMLFAVYLLPAVGCGDVSFPEAPPPEPMPKPVAVRPEPRGATAERDERARRPVRPISDASAEAFAAEMSTALYNGDIADFNRLIDWDNILERATDGISTPPPMRGQFIASVKQTQQGPLSVFNGIYSAVLDGADFRFLHAARRDGTVSVIFRILWPEQGALNYQEFCLERREAGSLVATDLYIYAMGEYFSDALRREYIQVVGRQSRSLFQRLRGAESAYAKELPLIERMVRQIQAKNHPGAMATYREMSPEVQQDKAILLMRLSAVQDAMHEDETAYLEALADYVESIDDVSSSLMGIDYYFLNGRFDEGLACIDRLDEQVGGDPYLDVARASIYVMQERYEAARRASQQAIAKERDLIPAYWTLVNCSLLEEDHAETARLLSILQDEFSIVFDPLETVPDYAEFVKSPEYREWLDSRAHLLAP